MITPNVEGFGVVRPLKTEHFGFLKLFLYFLHLWPQSRKSVIFYYRPLHQSDKTVLQSIPDRLRNMLFFAL